MRMPKELHSDEEFEQWVTVFAEWNTYSYSDGHKPAEDERMFEKMVTAKYERTLWYHRKRFNEWKKEHLQPLIDELVEHAPMTRSTTGSSYTNWSMPSYVA